MDKKIRVMERLREAEYVLREIRKEDFEERDREAVMYALGKIAMMLEILFKLRTEFVSICEIESIMQGEKLIEREKE